ncbi:Chitotriosidase-1 [Morella rubra]|uniref:Chitotriosidase-1 n=1 Tax=Morella rubra TaxID=262757 RepID=A0A6A1VGI8_9ROSI|nr:Chitotriosidase-1 [Morella rubra]
MSLSLRMCRSNAQSWIKVGFVDPCSSVSSVPIIDSNLFKHLVCVFDVNSSTYRISLTSADEQHFSNFIDIVKRTNPSVVTILSLYNGQATVSLLSSMVNQSSYRKSYMESSIKTARKYRFQGIDLSWLIWSNTTSDMTNAGVVLDEWRVEVDSE